jgi:predicted dehydrogenase
MEDVIVAVHEPVRWGILGTAQIAIDSFMPAVRAAGGVLAAVGGRDLEHTRRYAEDNGVERALDGYEAVLQDGSIDAVYIPLPNSLHAEWTIAALREEKAILCEKPLTPSLEDTERVLTFAEETAGLLWEAFVFPFREQTSRLLDLLAGGRIGEVREVHVNWHFMLANRADIRLQRELGGGALLDIGCYAIRLARMIFDDDTDGGMATATWSAGGVDEEMAGVLSFPDNRRLVFSLGMRRGPEQSTRILGTGGEIQLTNAYHPSARDTLRIFERGQLQEEQRVSEDVPTFTRALEHIHRVLWGLESPRHLATEEALGNAVALNVLDRSARSGRYEMPARTLGK